MAAESLSELTLVASIQGKGKLRAKIYKHLAPTTVGKLQRSLPFGGIVNFFEKNFVYIATPLVQGEEKSRRDFKRAQLAFMPAGSMLCFFLDDTKSYQPLNPLGEVTEGLELLDNLKRGDSIRVENIGMSC